MSTSADVTTDRLLDAMRKQAPFCEHYALRSCAERWPEEPETWCRRCLLSAAVERIEALEADRARLLRALTDSTVALEVIEASRGELHPLTPRDQRAQAEAAMRELRRLIEQGRAAIDAAMTPAPAPEDR